MPELEVHSVDIAILLIYVLGTRIILGWWDIQFLYAAGAMLAMSLAIFITASYVTSPPPPERVRCCTMPLRVWCRDAASADAALSSERWTIGERWFAVLLLALTLVVVLWWQ